MKRGLRAKCGFYEDAMVEEVECPNCGTLHPKRYNLMSGARGCGKSLQRVADELDFCDVKCLIEWAKDCRIGETVQND